MKDIGIIVESSGKAYIELDYYNELRKRAEAVVEAFIDPGTNDSQVFDKISDLRDHLK